MYIFGIVLEASLSRQNKEEEGRWKRKAFSNPVALNERRQTRVRAILAHLINADRNHQTQAAQTHPAARLNHTGPPSAFGSILWYISCLAAISPSVIYQNNVILTFPPASSSGTLSHFTGNEETHLCLLRQRTHHKSWMVPLKRILSLWINPNCACRVVWAKC